MTNTEIVLKYFPDAVLINDNPKLKCVTFNADVVGEVILSSINLNNLCDALRKDYYIIKLVDGTEDLIVARLSFYNN